VETGCGKTTILFSQLSRRHVVFAVDDSQHTGSSVTYFRSCPEFRAESTRLVTGPTQTTLPAYRFDRKIDVAYIDGPHGFPFPDLEYFHFYPHIRRDGWLIIDDIHIPTINNLYGFLREDEMWQEVRVVATTGFLRRTGAATFPTTGDGWWLQQFNKRRFPVPVEGAPAAVAEVAAAIDDRRGRTYFVDIVNADQLGGWALGPDDAGPISVYVDGRAVGNAYHGIPRPDVGAQHPEAPNSGFVYSFRDADFAGSSSTEASIEVRLGTVSESFRVPRPRGRSLDGSALEEEGFARDSRLSLPRGVVRLLRDLRGDAAYGGRPTAEITTEVINDVCYLARRGTKTMPALFGYLSFLAIMWTKARFVECHFPRANLASQDASKDWCGVASSPVEMFAIAAHLAMLMSWGLGGSLVEFGCFKGFSTSILSEACFQLGVSLDVFDSFEGLPPSGSGYYSAGEFAGSLEEVTRNVAEFGRLPVVRFHRGFFANTVPVEVPRDVLCVWMDVDLESSSRDAMAILPSVPRRSCVFSRECTPESFVGDRVTAERGANSVVPPILDAFAAAGRQVAGRFVASNTGCFWDAEVGIPPLPVSALMRLRDLATDTT
jgi:hypothetical protein